MPSGTRATGVGVLAVAALVLATAPVSRGQVPSAASDVAVKAAFIFNFAKFAEWPGLPADGPIVTCIVGDDAIAAAFVDTVKDQRVNGRVVRVSPDPDASAWHECQVLFVGEAAARRSAADLDRLKPRPVLTVSDRKDFASTSGVVELYVDDGRMRFAINVEAAERAGLRLSSRLLGLARIVKDSHVR